MIQKELPLIRSGERRDYKRCVKRWYWTWRRGLVPRGKDFGALDLGTWMHAALAEWYGEGLTRSESTLAELFTIAADAAIAQARQDDVPEYVVDKADELAALGIEMATAYQKYYGDDPEVFVLGAEIPLEFSLPDPDTGELLALHKLKPDLVYVDPDDNAWLMEHKTAASIRTEHLVIDDQARPYGAMAERALRNLGVLKGYKFKGIMYNFLRKALPDQRQTNAEGKYLNKSNGQVSKKQPPPFFVRKPITLTAKAKRITLLRTQAETVTMTKMTMLLRRQPELAAALPKTPHTSCPKFCPFFAMCVAEEEGTDIRDMERIMFVRRNPYLYEEETTDERPSFEMG
jgi:PD-(D/E)XK nuclease superfamily